jgi:hypothetical protein
MYSGFPDGDPRDFKDFTGKERSDTFFVLEVL